VKITEISLRRPAGLIVLTLALVLFGILGMRGMGVQRTPDVDFPIVAVTTTMRGASATVMDNDVTDVIEEKLSTISGIESLSSSSYEGRATTVVQFDLGRDIDAAAADVRDRVNLALNDLPDEADTPVVTKYQTGDDPIVTVAVTGPASYREKAVFVDKVAVARFQSVDGVGNVDTPGLRKREIRVWLDPALLEARGLTVSDVSKAINRKHVELPGGNIETDRQKIEIRLAGEVESIEGLRRLPIASGSGGIVRMADVARVEDGFEEKIKSAFLDGREAILISIQKQRGSNEVAVSDAVLARVEELKRIAPRGIELQVVSNTADFVRRSMKGVATNLAQAVFLCSLVMLFFLRTLRTTFVAVITIPVCLLGSFIFLKALGLTINNLTMLGLSLAVGMVVDATVVVLENVHRHLEGGMAAFQASELGTGEVAFSVLAGAATTIAVFAPIAFLGGIIGRFFYSFGVTVVFTIALSLLLSLTLTPFLCSRTLHKDHPGRFATAVEGFLSWLDEAYRTVLRKAIAHRWVTLGLAGGLFVLGLLFAFNIGTGLYPSDDQGTFNISFELPAGASLSETERVLAQVDRIVRADKSVAYTFGETGTGGGQQSNRGRLFVNLVPRKERPGVKTIMSRMRRALSGFRDVRFTFAIFGGADLRMTLVGGTPESLMAIGEKVLADLGRDGRLTDLDTDVRLDKPQLNIALDRARTDDLDIDIRDLSTEVQSVFGGAKAGVFKDGGFRYDIRLMAGPDLRKSSLDVGRIAVKTASGNIVRIPGLVRVERDKAPNVVKRYNRQPSLQVSGNVVPGFSTGEGIALVNQAVRKFLPADGTVTVRATGRSRNQQEDFRRLLGALAVAVVLVYMVMVIQFESFLHPFTVMFSLPLLTPGAFGLLFLAGNNLDMMSFMGIILLVGIVVNNAILLVDFINQQRAKGVEKVQAVINAGPLRLRAILMTAVSTMAGSIPVALKLSEGAEFRQPMAVAVVGGMFTSTFLTLLVIPVAYLVLDDAVERSQILMRWFRAARSRNGLVETLQKLIPGGK
jgi:HAE1 family hydrophobic/amphiphilic exporter-1